jgi:hypothetical protein
VIRGRRRPLAPHALDQAIARDGLIRVQEEDCEKGPLLRSSERQLTAVAPHLDRTEKSKVHRE